MAASIILPDPEGKPDLLIIAGEHSGDQHAARLLNALKKKHPKLNVCALGGPELAKSGAQLLFDLTASSVVGLFEVLKNYGFFKQLFSATISWIRTYQPHLICFVDYPGFNLRVAQRLHEEGIAAKAGGPTHLLYYIGPQIWAWKAGRRFKMARVLDSLAVIFPFEVDCYKDTDLDVQFVGHPFVQEDYQLPLSYAADDPLLLLPGSRKAPVGRIFPLMLAAFERWLEQAPDDRAIVLYPSQLVLELLEQKLKDYPALRDRVQLVAQENAVTAKAVLTSSGTMSLNCVLAGIPGLIVYKANIFTYWIGKRLVKIPYLGIANILLNQPVYPEYLQGMARVENLQQALAECLTPERVATTCEQAERVKQLLMAAPAGSPVEWLERFL